MLANNLSAAPRPRPPAKARRVSSLVKSSPPPPYAIASPTTNELPGPRKNTLLGSPILNTVQMLGGWEAQPMSPLADDWTNEKSREELSELLLKADGLIKERESELTMTTAVCKSLYESNMELKNRHQALLARLPVSPSISPPCSASTSPVSSSPPLLHSPQYYGTVISRSSSRMSTSSLEAPRSRHQRRISVSPSDIALLSDQNAELLYKLEKLESESIQADQAGRRKLRKLEQEIQGLRDELDETRARSEELEETARNALKGRAKDSDEISRKKLEREERLRALRGKPEYDPEIDEVRDFAPGGALSANGSSKLGLGLPSSFRFTSHRYASECIPGSTSRRDAMDDLDGYPPSASIGRSVSQPSQFPPAHEYALVSQLLLKIRELEETNSQITEQQAKTAAQMLSVKMDAESIRRVYESLGEADDVEWRVVEDGTDDADGDTTGDETIRFRNLRRFLDSEPSLEFESGINADIQGTLRNALVPQHIPVPAAHMHKSRKSVVGLFDSPGSIDGDSRHQPPLSLTIPGLPIPFSTNIAETPTSSTSISPASVDVSPIGHTGRTLDSELGGKIGEDWGFSAGNHHFRTSSLYNLTTITPTASSGSGFGSVRQPNLSSEELRSRSTTTTDIDTTVSADSHSQISPNEITPTLTDVSSKTTPSDDLLLPGTWRGHTPPIQPHIESQAEKKRRMSQTIRQRTTRWGEGRFTESLLTNRAPPRTDARIEPDRPLTPIPQRLANVFDAVVETIAGARESGEASPARSPTTLGHENGSAVTLRVREATKEEKQGGIVSFVLEVWLWLQFVIIILVFLWAMAKRGPKSVLEDAERKKLGSR